MASRLPKLCPRMLVSSTAVFIFLSDTTSWLSNSPALVMAEQATRCYWCGPLAEQVHRSQRAPSCNQFDQHETTCDKGYTHCAVVATAPPYAESRLCVKFYQDECYSLYCNSTKTWRMICPCQGDLCNGNLTDRETKAFATLARIVGKTNARIKRSLISGFISVKTKTPPDNNTIIIINNPPDNNTTLIINNQTAKDIDSLQNDEPVKEQSENATTIAINEMTKHVEENIIIEHGISDEKGDMISNKAETIDESKMGNASPATPDTEENHNAKMEKVEKTTTPITEYTTAVEYVKVTHNDMEHAAISSMKPTTFQIELTVVHNSVKSDKLPPAQALQQNITPTKAMEVTTIGTISLSTEDIQVTELSTPQNETNKNNGARDLNHLTIIVFSFILHHYL